MEMSFDRWLGILGVLGIFIGVGVAIAMDPKSKGELVFAVGCFIFSGVALCVSVGIWGFLSTKFSTSRIFVCGVLFAVICVSMVGASRWANGRYRVDSVEALPVKSVAEVEKHEVSKPELPKVEVPAVRHSKKEPPKAVPENTQNGFHERIDSYSFSLAWIIHDFAGEKRKGALKD